MYIPDIYIHVRMYVHVYICMYIYIYIFILAHGYEGMPIYHGRGVMAVFMGRGVCSRGLFTQHKSGNRTTGWKLDQILRSLPPRDQLLPTMSHPNPVEGLQSLQNNALDASAPLLLTSDGTEIIIVVLTPMVLKPCIPNHSGN